MTRAAALEAVTVYLGERQKATSQRWRDHHMTSAVKYAGAYLARFASLRPEWRRYQDQIRAALRDYDRTNDPGRTLGVDTF